MLRNPYDREKKDQPFFCTKDNPNLKVEPEYIQSNPLYAMSLVLLLWPGLDILK